MKKIFLLAILVFAISVVKSQNKTIDLEAYWQYRENYRIAEKQKNKTEIKRLDSIYKTKYGKKAVAKRAKEGDPEACAYLAGYYDTDYYEKWRKSDLKKAVYYYRKALAGTHDDIQILFRYARFLDKVKGIGYNIWALTETDELDNSFRFYDRTGKYYEHVYDHDELKQELEKHIFGYLKKAADKGHRLAAYLTARIYRCMDVYLNFNYRYLPRKGWDVLERVYGYKRADEICFYANHIDGIYPIRNNEVVKYYTIAASNGDPLFQMEFAEYLFLSLCQGWFGDWSSAPSINNGPFIYKGNHTNRFNGFNYNNDPSYRDVFRKVFNGYELEYDNIDDDDIEEQMIYWYLQAAKQDYAPAMVNVAFFMYYTGYPYDDSGASEIIHWLERASELGNTTAMYNLSVVKKYNKEYEDAFNWAKRGADSGDFKCQHLLGRYYYYGIGVSIDKNKSLAWFKMAADNGSEGASYMTGLLYADRLVGNNMAMAVKYYEAAKNIREANEKLSECYSKGVGVIMDKQKAHYYEEKAHKEESGCVSYNVFSPGLCLYSYVLSAKEKHQWMLNPLPFKQPQL